MQQNAEDAPGSSTAGLAHLLLNSYQEQLIQNRLQEEQEREEGAQEEDEDEEDDGKRRWQAKNRDSPVSVSQSSRACLCPAVDDPVQQKGEEPTPEEKALLREEFITQMHQRFLDGKDKDFNYRSATTV